MCFEAFNFFPESSSKRLFHDTSGGILQLLLLTRNPSLLVLNIYGISNFLKMLRQVDHDNLRPVFLQTPNTSHSYPF